MSIVTAGISFDEGAFFIQGIELDYCASGESEEEAISNFIRGLQKTIELRISKFGDWKISPPPSYLLVDFDKIVSLNIEGI